MAELQYLPLHVEDNQAIRASRSSFQDVGIDDFIQPPEKGVLERRWGTRPFVPKVDTGATIDDDETANPFS
jgi:hypothetical protein